MEIIIHDKDAHRHSMDCIEALWAIYVRKGRRALWVQFGLGILFLMAGYSPLSNTLFDTTHYDRVAQGTRTIHHGQIADIFGAIGAVYLYILVVGLISRSSRKTTFLADGQRFADVSYKEMNEDKVTITEEGRSAETPTYTSTMKWEIYISFSRFKGFLVLNVGRSPSGYSRQIVDLRSVSQEEQEELYGFLRERMAEIRV
jgi:hypothetical protein